MSVRRPFALFSLVRFLLYPFALIYGVVVWLRNRLYDSGFSSSVEFSLPVICVGNLSVGGTGKTPHVEYLIRRLQYQYRVATMSRGYKRSTQGFVLADGQSNALRIGDEPMQYHLAFPEVVVSVAEERMTGIPLLLQRRPDVEVVILDDAFQHRSVKAGLNMLITDYARPFYEDYILPYGRLREGRSAYKRAQVIIVSKCPPALTREAANGMIRNIAPINGQEVFFSSIRYGAAYHLLSRDFVELRNKNIVLVCCIARPEPLVAYLKSLAKDLHVLAYADHHYFGSRDLEEIRQAYESWQVPDKIILTTEKDATRLLLHRELLADMNLPIAVLPIEVAILFGEEEKLNTIIEAYVAKTVAEQNDWVNPEG
jgi:tetraacyldisaccharide 4'-kinase